MRATAASALLALALLGAGSDSLPAAPAERGAARVSVRDREGREVGLYRGSYALLIGNSVYSNGWQHLESVPAEMAEVKRALIGHGFEVEEVATATADRLRQAFRDFVRRHGYVRDNRLLFYFAGHGYTRASQGKAYLVPVDAPQPVIDEPGFLDKAMDLAEIELWAKRIEAKHALFVFDSCFSGAIFKTRSALETPPHISAYLMKDVRQFITSGSASEQVPAQSVFSRLLVRALGGDGDLDRDGYVTGTELGLYLHREVLARRVGQTPQFGKIRDPALDEGDFVFVTGRREEPPPPPPPPPERTAPPRPERWSRGDLRQDGRSRSDRQDRLQRMRTEYSRLLDLDKQEGDPEQKAAAWRKFLHEFRDDDSLTTEDDDLLAKAEQSAIGWQGAARRAGPGMGTESEAQASQTPVRETLDIRLVSRAEYEDCVRRNWCSALSRSGPCNRAVVSNRGSRPVICASWDQAVAFCQWDDGRRARGRLPRREDWLDAEGAGRSVEPTLKEWIAGRPDEAPAFRTRSAIAHDPSGSVKALSVDRGEGQPNISFRCVRPESAPPG